MGSLRFNVDPQSVDLSFGPGIVTAAQLSCLCLVLILVGGSAASRMSLDWVCGDGQTPRTDQTSRRASILLAYYYLSDSLRFPKYPPSLVGL